jgi:hypothetical protein
VYFVQLRWVFARSCTTVTRKLSVSFVRFRYLHAGYIGIFSKLYHMYNDMRYSLVTNNPVFIALTTMVLEHNYFLLDSLVKSF